MSINSHPISNCHRTCSHGFNTFKLTVFPGNLMMRAHHQRPHSFLYSSIVISIEAKPRLNLLKHSLWLPPSLGTNCASLPTHPQWCKTNHYNALTEPPQYTSDPVHRPPVQSVLDSHSPPVLVPHHSSVYIP